MSTIKDRILQIAENKGFKRTEFPEKIGMSYSSFKSNGSKSAINSDALDKLMSVIPDVDLHWLVTGEKKKVETPTIEAVKEDQEKYSKKYKDLYIEVLEENRILNKKLVKCLEQNQSLKKYN